MTTTLTKICSVKMNIMKVAYVPDSLMYCRNVCDGYSTDEKPCPHGMYRAFDRSEEERK